MSNMGYCRFQNTLKDLRDCQEHIFDDELDLGEDLGAAASWKSWMNRLAIKYTK